MSSGSQEKNTEILRELARELRQFQGLSASFFRAAAAQMKMTVTDMQVIDLLESVGPMTAGQLADLTGLTTGAITGMLNRLEEAGVVRRERDPNDGRKVIVQLAGRPGNTHKIGSTFASVGEAWEELASHYDEKQRAFLLEFLKRSNALSREQIIRLREAPSGEGGIYSAPLGDLTSARLLVSSGVSRLMVRADNAMAGLYQARFQGVVPDVKVKNGEVSIRYSRRLWALTGEQRVVEVTLSTTIPWQIMIQGGAVEVDGLLSGLNLAGLEAKGGLSMIHLQLPVPSGVVPIRLSGGASEIVVRRPVGVAARAHLKGWVSHFIFDEQTFSNMGSNVWLQSTDFDPASPYYDIEVASSASMVTITAG